MFFEESFLFQTVQKPTRGSNTLDLVFTNNNYLIHTCDVGEPLANRDHDITRINLNFQIESRGNALLVPITINRRILQA